MRVIGKSSFKKTTSLKTHIRNIFLKLVLERNYEKELAQNTKRLVQ